MNVSYKVDVAEPVLRFEMMASEAQNPSRILNRWGGYLRSEARKTFEAQDFEPWSDEYKKRLEQTRTAAVTVHGELRKSYVGNLTKYLRGRMKAGVVTAGADLAELQRLAAKYGKDGKKLAAGGAVGETDAWVKAGESKAIGRLRKQLEKTRATGKRTGGNRRKITGRKILGRLSGSIYWDVQGRTVKVLSRVPWSGVHNLGGSAGNGATMPPRTYLDITAGNTTTMAAIALQQLLGK